MSRIRKLNRYFNNQTQSKSYWNVERKKLKTQVT